jgi:hypothetical protein
VTDGVDGGSARGLTRRLAHRYRSACRVEKARILDELCATTGWHRDHARKALRTAVNPKPGAPQPTSRKQRDPVYGPEVIAALRKVWVVLDAPAGKRLAPFLPEIVDRLIACGELDISQETRYQLVRMSAATIDRRLAADRAHWQSRARSQAGNGTLSRSPIPVRTMADRIEVRPGFVEIDLVGHAGGGPDGDVAQTITVTDIATGWTENRAVCDKTQHRVLPALSEIVTAFPFPVLGIESGNGSEFVNTHLAVFCRQHEISFTRARPGGRHDGARVEQKSLAAVRQAVGYHRYTGEVQVDLLNGIYTLLHAHINFFTPQQRLVSKTRDGVKTVKKHDIAKTSFQRVCADPTIDASGKRLLRSHYLTLNPVAIRREILALSEDLARVASAHDATNPRTRAS